MTEWTPGEKHPETPKWVFKNVWSRDRLRAILKSRCALCDIVLSSKEEEVRELAIKCEKPDCRCRFYMTLQAHPVCFICYDMFHALYGNAGLKNMNYFKELDEKDKNGDDEKRRRMGL